MTQTIRSLLAQDLGDMMIRIRELEIENEKKETASRTVAEREQQKTDAEHKKADC
ncbi:hypothetical protein JF546_04145 [Nitratireductor aquimarinus]|uniref:hypothetical protein n=1 Tax=Nitratireductor aquimarinus TaxID=889300 RepID=UPI001A8DAFCD|nr:hypothetical protein [Nitratireductor aquimarinus]MBN8242197.1 hypothetical protein [Nitratireductor aquimarinus]MBY6130583.1 hypothetical protein [Nitratireductor aquimarinus]MCA1302661.1 hypothetical protein [Nitratireductor aquimarinus]